MELLQATMSYSETIQENMTHKIKLPKKEDLKKAQLRINKFINRTPVLTSSTLDKKLKCKVFFKCENFQKMGAFKMRGASNSLLKMNKNDLKKGVATHSSGNFAQAVALSSKMSGIKAHIVMPTNAPTVKKNSTIGYSANVIDCPPTLKDREETLQKVIDQTGASAMHPYNDMDVIEGNSTATMELLEDYPDLDAIFAPIGGGGLISGACLAAKYFSNAKVYGAEPEGADDAYRSFQKGEIIPMVNPQTIADGLRTSLGEIGFEIMKTHLDSIFTVSESEIVSAMKWMWQKMKIIIEPSSAVPLAALIKNHELFKDQQVGIIISGGNVDLDNLPF